MHTRACLVLVLVLGGCSGEEPSWEEGPIGEITEGLSVGGAGGCSTFYEEVVLNVPFTVDHDADSLVRGYCCLLHGARHRRSSPCRS